MSKKGRSPYDYVKNLSEKLDINAFDEKEYVPWMVNRIISLGGSKEAQLATVATGLNVPKRIHFLFYWYLLPHKKRFIKYYKKGADKALEAVMYIYGVDEAVGESYTALLTVEQIQIIISQTKFYKEG